MPFLRGLEILQQICVSIRARLGEVDLIARRVICVIPLKSVERLGRRVCGTKSPEARGRLGLLRGRSTFVLDVCTAVVPLAVYSGWRARNIRVDRYRLAEKTNGLRPMRYRLRGLAMLRILKRMVVPAGKFDTVLK